MINYWVKRASEILERELLLVKQTDKTKDWFNLMPNKIKAIIGLKNYIISEEDFTSVIGHVHHLRYTRLGIEGVLETSRRFQRYNHLVYYNKKLMPHDPFWLILSKKH